jgi:hypothetical protein
MKFDRDWALGIGYCVKIGDRGHVRKQKVIVDDATTNNIDVKTQEYPESCL